jgi:hypothetical protein
VRLQVWHGNKLISQTKLAVQSGPVTIKYPFSAGYTAGEYDLWGVRARAGREPEEAEADAPALEGEGLLARRSS